jgi:isocitrate dehydrogenase kinase/phosphatase
MQSSPSLAGARAIFASFAGFRDAFETISRRAAVRFAARDWHGVRADARERLDLYRRSIDPVVREIRDLLGPSIDDKAVWAEMKLRFAALIANRGDAEIAETYFNSVTRRLFATVGVDASIEFMRLDAPETPDCVASGACRVVERTGTTAELVERVLVDCRFATPFANLALDTRLVAERVDGHVARLPGAPRIDALEMLEPVFYRNKGAYLVGRVRCGAVMVPLVLALANGGDGIYVDAVLLAPNDASIVFSFTRSYFHVAADRPLELVAFLRSIMPLKPIAELYIAIGFHKHGKTLMYRELCGHLARSTDAFEEAPGTRGMVMSVFTLPSYDVVFKVIRDRFDYPKTTTRRDVLDRYRLVFEHDRAGRLVDTQEFEHLAFDLHRFPQRLVDELLRTARQSVRCEGGQVVVSHLYAERRLVPLNLYLGTASEDAAIEAVLDYGKAVKDLAAANIFPGDMLLKNFGVTRQGRVAFFDYDEVCLVTDCNFRRLPVATTLEDELDPEPWFHVGPNDVFPEEFRSFLGLDGVLREAYERTHGDLFTVEFWADVQLAIRAGEIADVVPYREDRRLR